MQPPTLNGQPKPADVIARGPHKYNEATRKYEEVNVLDTVTEYPREMWHHEKHEQAQAHSKSEQAEMEVNGWKTKPWAEKIVAKDTVVAHPVNLAEVVLQQELEMKQLKAKLEQMTSPGIGQEKKAAK